MLIFKMPSHEIDFELPLPNSDPQNAAPQKCLQLLLLKIPSFKADPQNAFA
jgi:hypothetical protein